MTDNPLSAMLSKPPTCDYCGDAHWPDEGHDAGSLIYQRNFERDHGRRPTYRDAVAHCEGQNLTLGIALAKAYGHDPDDPAELERV
jgi:hypothetical protein